MRINVNDLGLPPDEVAKMTDVYLILLTEMRDGRPRTAEELAARVPSAYRRASAVGGRLKKLAELGLVHRDDHYKDWTIDERLKR